MDKQVRFDVADDSTSLNRTYAGEFPTTRYQGSKRELTDWIWNIISQYDFTTVLDAFGGTGAVSYHAKKYGKRVVYNDYLNFNYHIGRALIENDTVTLSDDDVTFLLGEHDEFEYPTFIREEFEGMYFTDEENAWLDRMHTHIASLDDPYKRSLAYAAVCQSALSKRPYNLFHRSNLDMRLNDVDRSFGNKATWDRSFDKHFTSKVEEYNTAVFDNGESNTAYCKDILTWTPPNTDLVYLDPPYYDQQKQNGSTDYQYYYHFLEGFVDYESWPAQIDTTVKTKKLHHEPSPWTDPDQIYDAFTDVFELFADRIIVVSYNTAGKPTPDELQSLLQQYKNTVSVHFKDHQYALSKATDSPDEVLLVATE